MASIQRRPGVKRCVFWFCVPSPASPLHMFDFDFANFRYALERLENLFAVTLTVTAFIPVSIKGVSQGGSAARFAGAKNAACSEWRMRASDRQFR